MLTLNGITTNRSYVPEVCRGRNPPTILRGNTHSTTHSEQKKTRNGYDNCSAKCLTLNKRIMERKEKNAAFIAKIEAGDVNLNVLFAATKAFMGVGSAEEAVSRLKSKFEESDTNWYVTNVQEEYEHIMSLDEADAMLWAKYRKGFSQKPIKDANGHYIEVQVSTITVMIGKDLYEIDAQNGNLRLTSGQNIVVNAQVLRVLGRIMDGLGHVRSELE